MLLLIFLYGLVIGSFLNVVIDRIPREESLITKRSHCESCQHTLHWHDLIPVVSYVFLKGKCRYCHRAIGWQYPLIELLTGVLFASVYFFLFRQQLLHGLSVKLLFTFFYELFIVSSFIAIFFIDLKYGIIPDVIVYPAVFITFIYMLLLQPALFAQNILVGICACTFFFFLFAITKGRGMGLGDVKLAFLLGFFLGYPQIIIALYTAFLTGAVIACILIVARKKKFRGSTIPFGPFLVLGAMISIFSGQWIWQQVLLFILH